MAGQRTLRRRGKQALGKLQGQQGRFFGKQDAALHEALTALQGGYDRAIGEVGKQYGAARQGVLDREQSQMGSLSQGLASRGLGNTTIGANLQRGLGADTSRRLQELSASQAGQLGNLFAGQGQQMSGLQQNIARIYGLQEQAATNLGQHSLGLSQMTQEEGPDWLGIGGSVLGGLAGGPLGAGIGGMIGTGISGRGQGLGGYSQLFGQGLGGAGGGIWGDQLSSFFGFGGGK